MRQSLEAIKKRIMDYQKLNGFETIFDFINEDIDNILDSLSIVEKVINDDLEKRKNLTDEQKDRLDKEVYLNVLPEKLSSDDLKLISDRIEWATLNTFINEKYNCLLIPEDKWDLVTNDLLDCVGEDKWKDEYDY